MCVCVRVRVCVCACVCVCVYFVNQAWGQDGGILDQDELEVHKNTKRFHFIKNQEWLVYFRSTERKPTVFVAQ